MKIFCQRSKLWFVYHGDMGTNGSTLLMALWNFCVLYRRHLRRNAWTARENPPHVKTMMDIQLMREHRVSVVPRGKLIHLLK